MAPTICSGKKTRQTLSGSGDIRRRVRSTTQLNHSLSNIVNYVAKGSLNSRAAATFRVRSHDEDTLESEFQADKRAVATGPTLETTATALGSATGATGATEATEAFISDDAVSSSTQADDNPADSTSAQCSVHLEAYPASSSSRSTSTPNSPTMTSVYSRTGTPFSESYDEDEDEDTLQYSYRMMDTMDANDRESLQQEEREVSRHADDVDMDADDENEEEDEDGDGDDDDDDGDDGVDGDAANAKVHSMSSSQHAADSGDDVGEDEDDDELSKISGGTRSARKLRNIYKQVFNDPLLSDKLLRPAGAFKSNSAANDSSNDSGNGSSSGTGSGSGSGSSSSSGKAYSDIRNTEGLLSIAIKTIKLVKRNQLLQQRLAQLQLETSEFIQSVLANPENRHFREKMQQKVAKVENV